MASKETIALVVNAKEICAELIHRLAGEHYRLLLVTENEPHLKNVVDSIEGELPDAEIEIIHCVKEGCWEADIIVLLEESEYQDYFLKRIREVSTQKIVVGISIENLNTRGSSIETGDLKLLLPHSKIVQLVYNRKSKPAFISWEDKEASNSIAAIAKKLGYNVEMVITL